MQLVTDRAADLSPEQLDALDIDIHYLPLTLSLDGKEYISGVDIQPEEFYNLLESSDDMPSTSLPAPEEAANIFREIAETTGDNELMAVLISNGLSGTFNSARIAAEQVKADGITVHMVDTRTLSGAEGWQVAAAGRAIMAGWSVEKTRDLLGEISKVTNSVFTLPDLKYLIHGGRIGHMKGLLASALGIKPLIGVSYEEGRYEQRGQARTFKRAVRALADDIAKNIEPGSRIRVHPLHALSMEAIEQMQAAISDKFDATFMTPTPIAPVLGAHTGLGMVGCAFAPLDKLPELP
jgi:DegV family protein with EDD domain